MLSVVVVRLRPVWVSDHTDRGFEHNAAGGVGDGSGDLAGGAYALRHGAEEMRERGTRECRRFGRSVESMDARWLE